MILKPLFLPFQKEVVADVFETRQNGVCFHMTFSPNLKWAYYNHYFNFHGLSHGH